MLLHTALGNTTIERTQALKALIKKGKIALGGNRKLKIYGTLDCSSGKRMKIENRVFFASASEAVHAGFRPCGHCMKGQYELWKKRK